MTTTAPLPLAASDPPVRLPYYHNLCDAGFPSPASDYVESTLSLDELIGASRPETYFVRATGRSQVRAGVWPGDLLIIDAACPPRDGDLVVAFVDGGHTVKRFCRVGRKVWLAPDPLPEEAHAYAEIHDAEDLVICGVVTFTLRSHRPSRRDR
ncbi:MAG: S24 family peptidase [Bacteroidota bacterium]